ncbi:hypothetical protein BD413DRAFT_146471 [Trametes elegans]|nr:hypothetical protein BD413DRAFT_146471 [Trametes elegans]
MALTPSHPPPSPLPHPRYLMPTCPPLQLMSLASLIIRLCVSATCARRVVHFVFPFSASISSCTCTRRRMAQAFRPHTCILAHTHRRILLCFLGPFPSPSYSPHPLARSRSICSLPLLPLVWFGDAPCRVYIIFPSSPIPTIVHQPTHPHIFPIAIAILILCLMCPCSCPAFLPGRRFGVRSSITPSPAHSLTRTSIV